MKRILKHTAFWIGVFVFYTCMNCDNSLFAVRATYLVGTIPFFMAVYYMLQYLLIPNLLSKGRHLAFGISVAIWTSLLVLAYQGIQVFLLDVFFYPEVEFEFINVTLALGAIVRLYTPALVIIAVKAHFDRLAEKERLHALQQERVSTELKYLKAQLNPHFLFNTLNNLYSYVLTNSPKAPDMILRLSEILDYALYKSQEPSVPLSQEIKLIDNYLELEKIRYGDRLVVQFYKPTRAINNPITPLLLLSVVENAFKHGAGSGVERPKIKISLKEDQEQISFKVWNNKLDHPIPRSNDDYKEGIGLFNIKRQLELIYPDRHEVKIKEGSHFFELALRINTLSHAG